MKVAVFFFVEYVVVVCKEGRGDLLIRSFAISFQFEYLYIYLNRDLMWR